MVFQFSNKIKTLPHLQVNIEHSLPKRHYRSLKEDLRTSDMYAKTRKNIDKQLSYVR